MRELARDEKDFIQAVVRQTCDSSSFAKALSHFMDVTSLSLIREAL